VSGRQLDHPAFSLQVAEVLAMSGLDAGRLQLEITETAPLHERSLAGENLRELRSMGVSIVLDDFGTGWSSLEYLARFPVDAVKLDRGFVARVGREPRAALIVDAIVDLARRLDIEVVAEGVETGAQRDEVHAAGCSLAQGFFFGAPREAAELVGTYS
jgi:EAL domain-containing protein (putative c-di-GMP-specific phosphodiesterase class I)